MIIINQFTHKYRESIVLPSSYLRRRKFWPNVSGSWGRLSVSSFLLLLMFVLLLLSTDSFRLMSASTTSISPIISFFSLWSYSSFFLFWAYRKAILLAWSLYFPIVFIVPLIIFCCSVSEDKAKIDFDISRLIFLLLLLL